jgi:hypothetical protein
LEKAKELIEKQRREIQELRDKQQKSIKSYENIMTHLNERLLEQETEASAMKHEISTMIQQQQQIHSNEMREMYNRMMQQMANMLNMRNVPIPSIQTQHSALTNQNTQYQQQPEPTQRPEEDPHPGKAKARHMTITNKAKTANLATLTK